MKNVIPTGCFYGCGVDKGPHIFMTDDSSAERNALQSAWPSARLLLCVFHFLQRHWTWLHDGNNSIANDDRKVLIKNARRLKGNDCILLLQIFHMDYKMLESGSHGHSELV